MEGCQWASLRRMVACLPLRQQMTSDVTVAITFHPSVIASDGSGDLRRGLQRMRPGVLCQLQHLVYTLAQVAVKIRVGQRGSNRSTSLAVRYRCRNL
jgi:hypothetical protein